MKKTAVYLNVVALISLLLLGMGQAAAAAEAPSDPGWLGVSLISSRQAPAADEAGSMPAGPAGAQVAGVVKGSPADRAGLRASDVILRVDGREVGSASQLVRAVKSRESGAWLQLEIRRDEEERRLQVRLGSREDRSGRMPIKRGWAGLTLVGVPQQLREYWGGSEDSGVLVGAIEDRSPAAVSGLRPGDLILSVDGEPFADARALTVAIRRGGIGNDVELEVSRQGAVFRIDLEIMQQPRESSDERA